MKENNTSSRVHADTIPESQTLVTCKKSKEASKLLSPQIDHCIFYPSLISPVTAALSGRQWVDERRAVQWQPGVLDAEHDGALL